MIKIGKTDINRVRQTEAYKWAFATASGKTPHRQGLYIKLFAERFLNDLKRDDLFFDVEAYARLIRYYAIFKHTKGLLRGKPFALRPDQCAFIGQIIAWTRREDGERRIRSAYKEVAKKNGKSWEAGGLAGYMLTSDDEAESEIYSLATSERQARESWRAFKSMSKTTSKYQKKIEYRTDEIRHPKSGSFFTPLPSTGDLLDGKNAYLTIADEYHLFRPRDDMSLASLKSGGVARKYALDFKITTAGWNTFGSCFDERKRAINILKGTIKLDSYLPVIFTLDDKDDWQSEDNWYKSNPALGLSKSLAAMRDEYETAMASPRLINNFKNKQLDLWTNSATSWLDVDKWRKLEHKISPDILRGKRCVIGLDLSDRNDLTAAVALFPPQDGLSKFYVLPWLYVPAVSAIRRESMDKVPYMAWSLQGFLKICDSGYINKKFITSELLQIAQIYNIEVVAYDPWHAADIAEELDAQGVCTEPVRYGFKTLSAPTKQLEELIKDGDIEHDGNECFAWQIGNVVVRRDENKNIIPDKLKSTERIDGVAALINAICVLITKQKNTRVIDNCPVRIL